MQNGDQAICTPFKIVRKYEKIITQFQKTQKNMYSSISSRHAQRAITKTRGELENLLKLSPIGLYPLLMVWYGVWKCASLSPNYSACESRGNREDFKR